MATEGGGWWVVGFRCHLRRRCNSPCSFRSSSFEETKSLSHNILQSKLWKPAIYQALPRCFVVNEGAKHHERESFHRRFVEDQFMPMTHSNCAK